MIQINGPSGTRAFDGDYKDTDRTAASLDHERLDEFDYIGADVDP